MEFWLLLGLAGWAGYSFLKANTKRGAETVRAHVFLGGIMAGASVEEAEMTSRFDVASEPTEVIHSAIAHVNGAYGGKQTAMISDACSKGMSSRLPQWYQAVMGLGKSTA